MATKILWQETSEGLYKAEIVDGVLRVTGYGDQGPPPSPAPTEALLQIRSFESGDLSGFYWSDNAPEAVTAPHPVRAGTHSMRSYVHRYQSPYKYRTEAQLASDPNMPPDDRISAFLFDIGAEYWFGFSIFVPADWVVDVKGLNDIVMQVQAIPDDGEIYRSPILPLRIDADSWQVVSQWDTRKQSPATNEFEGWAEVVRTPLGDSLGRWTDWVFHVKWSWQSDGFIKVWKDGTLVGTRNGPNCCNDARGPHFSFGLYKWPWASDYTTNTDWRLIYHDELRIGGASASYEDVAPPSY